jgi:DNA protecting protein DprA
MQLPAPLRLEASCILDEASFFSIYQNVSKHMTAAHEHVVGRQCVVLERMGISVVPCWDYPVWLRGMRPLPYALFVRGDVGVLQRRGLAVVGSRASSEGPMRWARGLAAREALEGGLVISGGARGIDAQAHEAALEHGACTVAYVGVACDKVYPAVHKGLFARMLQQGGALISEHAPGVNTYASAHALRNRFIAWHASVLAVAEAGEQSGTLGTARWALRAGRPVWIPPEEVGGERGGIEGLKGCQGVQVRSD